MRVRASITPAPCNSDSWKRCSNHADSTNDTATTAEPADDNDLGGRGDVFGSLADAIDRAAAGIADATRDVFDRPAPR